MQSRKERGLAGGRGGTGAAETGRAWHALPAEAVLSALGSTPSGLAPEEAARRLETQGANRLPAAARRSTLARILAQFHNLLIYVLIGSGLISLALGHLTDAVVIFAVVVINAAIGVVQEGKAERALDAIRGMIDPNASVVRGGRRLTVRAEAVVPGDVVVIEAGDRVPADMRLVKGRNLKVDEAVLTGESVPVDKAVQPVEAGAELAERVSMLHSGTFVASGSGLGVVVATGPATELGRISTLIGTVERLTTPLVRQMNGFARLITVVVLATSALVFAFAVLVRAHPWDEAFMIVVGLAVAAIPEGLPAVMTITLAVGVQRMARRNAIIRALPAVETLGAVSVICSDKTGTLTANEMTARRIVTEAGVVAVDGVGYRPEGAFRIGGAAVDPAAVPVLADLARAAILCSDADIREKDGVWAVDGDPMEGALVALATKAGQDAHALRCAFVRRDEIPFDSRHRFMATLHAAPDGGRVVTVKGAPEKIVGMSDRVATADGTAALDRARWLARIDELATEGLRVIALARHDRADGERLEAADVESGLTLLGFVGLIDPPRPEVLAAVAECRSAGIRIKMITGDHAATARAVAEQLRLADDPKVVVGSSLDGLDDEAFGRCAMEANVFARTSPEHKLRLVEALQADGSIVAMTGDGVNDAPALKRADVGVAMGNKGTEAAKEAAEIVLADDNFASIVAAVREGRTVYDNLTKVIAWTLPTNGGEAMAIVFAVLFGLTLPATPVQILWINTVTAVALGLTLAFEPTEPNAMRRPVRDAGRALLTPRLLWRVAFMSALMSAGTFFVFFEALARGRDLETARTLAVHAIVVMEIAYLFSIRYAHGTSFTWRGVLGTPAVLAGVGTAAAAQIAFSCWPSLQAVMGSRAVAIGDAVGVIGLGVGLLVVLEIEKWIARGLAARGRRSR